MKIDNHRWVFNEYGEAKTVLKLEKKDVFVELGTEEILIGLIGSIIHPSDFGLISGHYGRKPQLPHIGGREGIGEILAIGESVQNFKIGDWVRLPVNQGAWQTHVITHQEDINPYPIVPHKIPVEQAIGAFINPGTAYQLLKKNSHIKANDWIIQNGANSAVGKFVIQLAKIWNLHTINIVRSKETHYSVLKQYGADIIIEDSEEDIANYFKDKNFHRTVKLGLNCIGGKSAIRILNCIEDNGMLLTYGGAEKTLISFPTKYLIFRNIEFHGFWMDQWSRNTSVSNLQIMYGEIFDWLAEGKLKNDIEAIYPFECLPDALVHAQKERRMGKILIKGPYWK